jgi:hypothetical protein
LTKVIKRKVCLLRNRVPSKNRNKLYCHVIEWLQTGFSSVIGFIIFLQLLTTSKNYALTFLHTTSNYKTDYVFSAFTSRCLIEVSIGGRSPSSEFPNCPRPRSPACHSNSSQRLNPSGYLTDSLRFGSTHYTCTALA